MDEEESKTRRGAGGGARWLVAAGLILVGALVGLAVWLRRPSPRGRPAGPAAPAAAVAPGPSRTGAQPTPSPGVGQGSRPGQPELGPAIVVRPSNEPAEAVPAPIPLDPDQPRDPSWKPPVRVVGTGKPE